MLGIVTGMSSDAPTPAPAGTTRRQVVAGVVVSRGDVLCARRSRPEHLAGRWEFPGGKVEQGENPREALRRELQEELGITVQVDAEFESRHGPWPIDADHEMRAFFATLVTGEAEVGDSHDEICWLPVAELPTLEWLDADRPIADALAARPLAQPGH